MSLELSPADQAFQALATQPLEVVLQQLELGLKLSVRTISLAL